MASSADSFPGKIILLAEVTVKPGKGDEMQRLMTNSHKYSNSEEEPGCLAFRCTRHGDKFVVFEEYADKAALAKHFETPPFKAFSAAAPEIVVGRPDITYFEEFGSQ